MALLDSRKPRSSREATPRASTRGATDEPSLVKSAERTVRILETLAASPVRLTLADLQARVGYPRSSLHALIRTLRELKWVDTDESGSAFGIGPHALLSGTSYLDKDPALPFACEVLEDLRTEVGYTAHFARRDDAHVIYLASRESRDAVRTVTRVGRRLPAHLTALGRALLAELTAGEVEALLPDPLPAFTKHTVTDPGRLAAEIDRARANGWAFEREQGTVGTACVAAVVPYRIPATDAISVSMPAKAAKGAEVDRVSEAVVRHATALATTLRRAGIR